MHKHRKVWGIGMLKKTRRMNEQPGEFRRKCGWKSKEWYDSVWQN